MIKTAIIGVGNMGSKYAKLLQDDSINGMKLVAEGIPSRGSQDELDFEKEFEEELSKKCK